jgi:mRNA-degrading endonuclease toxin of MazEF toxin-antitoxin module
VFVNFNPVICHEQAGRTPGDRSDAEEREPHTEPLYVVPVTKQAKATPSRYS